MTFTGSTIMFSENIATGFGGAVCNDNAEIVFEGSKVDFVSNSVKSDEGHGGAITNLSRSEIAFTNSEAKFISNSADKGGAIYNVRFGTITFNDSSAAFIGNEAKSLGGAAYAESDSMLIFGANGKDIKLTFKDNKAGGELNDIRADLGGVINFDAQQGYSITLDEGIRINGEGTINKNGTGRLIFGKDSEVTGDFRINEGAVNLEDEVLLKGKEIKISSAGTFDMQNESANAVEAEKFESGGNLKIDIFNDGTNDIIKAGEAKVGGNLDINARVGRYNSEEYDIIIATGSAVEGVFISTSGNLDLQYRINYTDNPNIIKLIVEGTYESDFSNMRNLTFNQRATAKAIDRLSLDDKISNEFADFITKYESEDKSEKEKLEVLSETSGYFIANVIRNAAADSPNNEVYDKIRNHEEEERTNSGIWAQAKGGQETFKGNENSLGDYKDISYGGMIGFDRYIEGKGIVWGVYGRFSREEIEQRKHKAQGYKNGVGLYGGYVKEGYEIKAMALGSYDTYETKRHVLGRTAKGDLDAWTVSADVEGALKIKVSERMGIRPYVGIEGQNVNYGKFKEKGAGVIDLEVKGGDYFRSAARAGAGIEYEKEKWNVYARAEAKYLISGYEPEIKSVFRDTKGNFRSRGAEEGRVEGGAGIGGEVKIAKHWKLYANANYYAGEKYENIYGNAGIRYLFGKRQAEEDIEEEIEIEEEKVIVEEPIAQEEDIKESNERRANPEIKSYKLSVANFNTNSYELKPEAKEIIRGQAEEIKGYEYKKITVEGHTDATGNDEINDPLSAKRARAVYDEFIINGIPVYKMRYIGFGSRLPIETNKTKEGRAANRRVEIFVE
jgi:autotransporter-associated beta strand protein